MDDDSEKKKAKGTKRCVTKREIMLENYKDSLFNKNTILRSQLRFKCDLHNVYTEEVNKIVLNSNDDKRLQTFDSVTSMWKQNDGSEKAQPIEHLLLRVNKMYT